MKSSVVPKKLRDAVLERDDWTCQRCGRVIGDEYQFFCGYSLQHRDPRGMGGSKLRHTYANLVTVCGTGTTMCHGYMESHRTESYRDGWLVPNGETPEEWPILRFGETYQSPGLEPGDEWTPAKPNPRQLEMQGDAA